MWWCQRSVKSVHKSKSNIISYSSLTNVTVAEWRGVKRFAARHNHAGGYAAGDWSEQRLWERHCYRW